MQSYPRVEMILVDDGSEDDLQGAVEPYFPLFEKRGYSLRMIRQENSGQSVAVNNALKMVRGEYLFWPDSDDYYCDDRALERMIQALHRSPSSVAMVRCGAIEVDEQSRRELRRVGVGQESISRPFEECMLGHNYYFPPVCYCARVSALDRCIPNREIYTEKRAGQNVQLMLPLLSRYDVVSIADTLSSVLVRSASHSRDTVGQYDRLVELNECYERTALSTLQRIEFDDATLREKYIAQLCEWYAMAFVRYAVIYERRDDFFANYRTLMPLLRGRGAWGEILKVELMRLAMVCPVLYGAYKKMKRWGRR